MLIRITKKWQRNQVAFIRDDGSNCRSDLGPALPFHDLAHFVAESALQMKDGFFGNIAKGYTVEQLSDKTIIKTLGPESWMAETISRALQSLGSGACIPEQFIPMVEAELKAQSIHLQHGLNEATIALMQEQFGKLKTQWEALPDGETLELTFR